MAHNAYANTQHTRHTEVDVVEAVFTGQITGSRHDTVFVTHNRFNHQHRCRSRGIVGAASFEQVDDFAATLTGAVDDGFEAIGSDGGSAALG